MEAPALAGPAQGTAPPGPVWGISGAGRLVGSWAWSESRLYEVLGSWASLLPGAGPADGDEARVRVYFDSCSQHHAWRSRLWAERLPGRLVQAYPGDSLPQPPPGLVGPLQGSVAALDALGETEGTVPRLAVYVRVVLPSVMVAYRAWRRAAPAASGRPVQRVLGLVLGDMAADWEEGCDILAAAMRDAGQAGPAAAATARVDAVLSSGALGPHVQ